jgi:hypothetical protein
LGLMCSYIGEGETICMCDCHGWFCIYL